MTKEKEQKKKEFIDDLKILSDKEMVAKYNVSIATIRLGKRKVGHKAKMGRKRKLDFLY